MVTRRSSDVDLQSRAGMRGLHSSKSIISSFPREKAETRNEWRFDLSPKARRENLLRIQTFSLSGLRRNDT